MALITVDEVKCTRCGICSDVCTGKLITRADEENIPFVPEEKEAYCMRCGHCEAFCPSGALTVNIRKDDKISLPKNSGAISPADLGIYLKKRRSTRIFKDEAVSEDKIKELIDISSY
ncbi:MAG: 4Fe-4S dicluster domain-containing protein, partial [Methanomicrobium sp.]|nr:4Fe-4S dicluster domain-containing protein [Methanomicrobium sp.]